MAVTTAKSQLHQKRFARAPANARERPREALPGATMPLGRTVLSKRVELSCWSNSEVLRWLIDEDQKQFIPAFLQHNVTGAMLKQMLSCTDLAQEHPEAEKEHPRAETSAQGGVIDADAAYPHIPSIGCLGETAVQSGASEAQLAGLISLLRVRLALPLCGSTAAVTPGQTINGWSYEREKDIWVRTHMISCERHRALVLQEQLRGNQSKAQLRTLVLSSLTTFLSALAAGYTSSDEDHTVLTTWSRLILLGLSFFITVSAGWGKIFSYERRLKDWATFFKGHPEHEEEMKLGKLQDLKLTMAPSPRDRLCSYDEFKEDFSLWLQSMPHWPEVGPGEWKSTLTCIAKEKPEIWSMYFSRFYETVFPLDFLCGKKQHEKMTPREREIRNTTFDCFWWTAWAKEVDSATYLEALNDHCTEGLLQQHWELDYDKDLKNRQKRNKSTGQESVDEETPLRLPPCNERERRGWRGWRWRLW